MLMLHYAYRTLPAIFYGFEIEMKTQFNQPGCALVSLL